MAALVQQMATDAHDPAPQVAVYFVSTRGPANQVTSGDVVDSRSLPVYVVVVRGRFSNPKWATEPLGAPPLVGNTLELIVNQKTGVVLDVGLVHETAKAYAALLTRLGGAHAEHRLTLPSIGTS